MTVPEHRISIEQLRVGLYIHLDAWMDHPFLFSSFKIRSEGQLKVLRTLGLKDVVYFPDKSDLPPLPPPRADAAPPPPRPVLWCTAIFKSPSAAK